jgi:hypothetical protein
MKSTLYNHSAVIIYSWIQGDIFFFQDQSYFIYAYSLTLNQMLTVDNTLSGNKLLSIIDGINCLLFVYETNII